MVFISLQSIADYFTEGQPRFNWLSMETGAMGIGGLNGVWMENSLFSLFWDILLAFWFSFLFLFLLTFWEMGGGEWQETTNQSTLALMKSALHFNLMWGIASPPLSFGKQTVSRERTFLVICPFHKNREISFSNITAYFLGNGSTWARYQSLDRAKVVSISAF